MWTVQKENNKLLEAEARELANVLNETLFSVVNKASDIKHATELLLNTGLINQKAVRNMAVINDYYIMRKNPLMMMKDIYYNLSVKYDISVNLVIKIVLTK
tara:strand:+ start:9968 stop:10270 length:303 start_codon:yes stop_codon:yes gene_type:complete